MKNQASIYTKLSNKYNIPRQVIEVVCNSPFRFANQAMTDCDDRPIMFAYLGKIKLKKKYAVTTIVDEIEEETTTDKTDNQ